MPGASHTDIPQTHRLLHTQEEKKTNPKDYFSNASSYWIPSSTFQSFFFYSYSEATILYLCVRVYIHGVFLVVEHCTQPCALWHGLQVSLPGVLPQGKERLAFKQAAV